MKTIIYLYVSVFLLGLPLLFGADLSEEKPVTTDLSSSVFSDTEMDSSNYRGGANRKALQEYHQAIQRKQKELDRILVSMDEQVAVLENKPSLTRQERLQLIQRRHQLIQKSPEAQQKLQEIRQFNHFFTKTHPGVLPDKHRVRSLRKNMKKVEKNNNAIDTLLAKQSEEYKQLISKKRKTPEELRRIRVLQKSLLPQNKEAQKLMLKNQLILRRSQSRMRSSTK